MIVGMVFLSESVVPLPNDLPCRVVDYHGTNRTTALIIALLRKQHGHSHEISIRQSSCEVIIQ